MNRADYQWCRRRALWYVSRYACTYNRLIDYLNHKGCQEYAKKIAEEFRQRGFIDEEMLGEALIARYGQKYGPKMIKQKLIQKGFSPETADELIERFHQKDEVQVILETIISRCFKSREQMMRFFLSRGFSTSAVIKAAREYEKLTRGDE